MLAMSMQLEMAIWARRHESIGGLVHHSDRGVRVYLNTLHGTACTGELAVRSVGSRVILMTMPPQNRLTACTNVSLIDLRKLTAGEPIRCALPRWLGAVV